jgi:hypothetical protein
VELHAVQPSTFNDPNSVSEQALSQQLPLPLIEAFIPCPGKKLHVAVAAVLAVAIAIEDQAAPAMTAASEGVWPLRETELPDPRVAMQPVA